MFSGNALKKNVYNLAYYKECLGSLKATNTSSYKHLEYKTLANVTVTA
jgi:hypothetical protein